MLHNSATIFPCQIVTIVARNSNYYSDKCDQCVMTHMTFCKPHYLCDRCDQCDLRVLITFSDVIVMMVTRLKSNTGRGETGERYSIRNSTNIIAAGTLSTCLQQRILLFEPLNKLASYAQCKMQGAVKD